ncbi:MAG: hypothetical protein R6V54_12015 [Desulfobacteraceae bacterium]
MFLPGTSGFPLEGSSKLAEFGHDFVYRMGLIPLLHGFYPVTVKQKG